MAFHQIDYCEKWLTFFTSSPIGRVAARIPRGFCNPSFSTRVVIRLDIIGRVIAGFTQQSWKTIQSCRDRDK